MKPIAFLVFAVFAACSSDGGLVTPDPTDTATPWPIDGGGLVGAPTSYKGLPLSLTSTSQPIPAVEAVDGRIGVVCVGMSNAQQACDTFIQNLETTWASQIDPRIVAVNCARGGHAIERWIDPAFEDELYGRCDALLAAKGIERRHVRVLLHKAANQFTTGTGGATLPFYPDPAADFFAFHANLGQFADVTPVEFPAVRVVYTAARSYGGFTERNDRGEPLSYEEGHALNRWLAENPTRGGVRWVWGPYLWAPSCDTGVRNGSDICYERSDYNADAVHPSDAGREKIAGLWHARLLAESWYRR